MEIDHARELYDHWSQLIKRQSNPYQVRQWANYLEAHEDGEISLTWSYRTRFSDDGYGLLPMARLHERGLIVANVGVWNGEPIIALAHKSSARAYYGEMTLLMVLYPDGDFLLKSHHRSAIRAICRHTFLGTFRFRKHDHVHVDTTPGWASGVSWVNIRDWRTRKPYFRLSAMPLDALYRVVDGVVQISPDPKDLPARAYDDYHNDHHEELLAAEYAYTERRYRLHHRKWARACNEPDPYAVLSPRRAKNLLIIQQMVQPYTPARSSLLKPLQAEQILQAQEGQ